MAKEVVRRKYYSTADIQEILGIGRTSANSLMHMFEERGQLFRYGNTLRVKISDFDKWVDENTGIKRKPVIRSMWDELEARRG
jgi:hypothetical protein